MYAAGGLPEPSNAYSEYARPPGRSLSTTVDQSDATAAGLTHASSVMPDVRSSELESATVTIPLAPLNDSAAPERPAAVHVAPPVIEPLFPLPEESLTAVPAPSSKW